MDDIRIIYEDSEVLVLDKPAGLVMHGDGVNTVPTLVDWLLENRPEIKGIGEPMQLPNGAVIDRPGIVHRLDRDTSGVVIVAKTQAAFMALKEQFQAHEVKKVYRALVYGLLKADEGVINRPIGRSRKDPRMRIAHLSAVGKLRPAETHYRVLKRLAESTYIEAEPKTGRTHQIRVHLKALHHPIVCDGLYAPGLWCPAGLNRQALHAYSLEVALPGGEVKKFEAPLPADFQAALDNLETA